MKRPSDTLVIGFMAGSAHAEPATTAEIHGCRGKKLEALMNINVLKPAVCISSVLAAIAGIGAFAQDLRPVHFSGTIDDYTPSTISGGPYQMRGQWTVDVEKTGAANASVTLNMETSDYGISDATAVDPTNPLTRTPHTHYISMTNGTVSYDTSVCPANSPATTAAGVVVTGTVSIAANGSPAPFESKGASTLQMCIIGGSEVQYSNVTLVLTGPATSHFGTQPIHGVVVKVAVN